MLDVAMMLIPFMILSLGSFAVGYFIGAIKGERETEREWRDRYRQMLKQKG